MGSGARIEKGIASRPVRRREEDRWLPQVDDEVAVEEPLQIRLAGELFVTTMRTPGDDEALVLGLLWSEGLIAGLADISAIAPCGQPGEQVLDVRPGPGTVFRIDGARRGTLTTASCGVCGRAQIDDLLARIEPQAPRDVAISAVDRALSALRVAQPRFERTGALHAAAALDEHGEVLASAEDIGRHNAVDKVVGMLLSGRMLTDARILVVSGRTSFEIIQKVASAGISTVVAVSGPTSLAIDLAKSAGIVLIGFAREGRMNVYTHSERLVRE